MLLKLSKVIGGIVCDTSWMSFWYCDAYPSFRLSDPIEVGALDNSPRCFVDCDRNVTVLSLNADDLAFVHVGQRLIELDVRHVTEFVSWHLFCPPRLCTRELGYRRSGNGRNRYPYGRCDPLTIGACYRVCPRNVRTDRP